MLKRIVAAALLAALSIQAGAEVWTARYGVAETFNFKLYNTDGTLDVDEADGGTEVSVSCNEGAQTTATNDFVDEGDFYSIALTAAELQCERIAVVVAATTTEVFFIQTIDSTSAMTPTIVQTGDNFARLGAPAGASIAADIAAVEAQTDDIGAAGAGLTNIDLPNQTMDITGTLSTVTAVTNTVSANVVQVSGDSAVADRLEALLDRTCGAYEEFGIARGGCTAQAATSTTIQLDASASFPNDSVVGMQVLACGSTQGTCQSRAITDYVSSTDTATVSEWAVTPSGTITYWVFGSAPIDAINANVVSIEGTDASDYDDTRFQPLTDIATYVGTPDDFGSGASLADNLADIEAQTDDIGVAGAGLTAADDAVVALLGAPAGASLAADIAAVESQTDDIGVAGAGLTAADDATLAAITALNDISIDDIKGMVIEDQSGSQINFECALRAITAYVGGDLSTSSGTSTYEDATGTDPLIVAVITGTAGNRNGTISCATTP